MPHINVPIFRVSLTFEIIITKSALLNCTNHLNREQLRHCLYKLHWSKAFNAKLPQQVSPFYKVSFMTRWPAGKYLPFSNVAAIESG